jgi:hypothetical protein
LSELSPEFYWREKFESFSEKNSHSIDMDLAYLHIVTNHIPIIGVPFALILLLLGIWSRSDVLKAAAFLTFAVLGIATLGVFLLGQGGEDFVEELAGVSHDAIEDHEKMGLVSLIAVSITAIVSLFGLIFYKGWSVLKRRKSDKLLNGETDENAKPFFPNWIVFAVLFLAVLSAGILGYTGKLGGKIRHTEFYGGAVETDDESGRNRRGRNERNNETAEPDTENPQTEEADTDGGGKGRGRGRGGRK